MTNYTTKQKTANLGNDAIDRMLDEALVSSKDQLEEDPVVMKIGESEVGTLGNFSSSNGKPKSRKTYSTCAIAAAALTGKIQLKFLVCLPEAKNFVLVIDTEQSRYHCQKSLHRIARLCGCQPGEQPANLIFLSLRPYMPEERIAMIERKISCTNNLGLVILDGVRDLAYDINSPQEATEVISKLMKWTQNGYFHLHAVIHQNKADSSSRGHLGTELNNKSESVLEIFKDPNNEDNSIVKGALMRDILFSPFAFTVNKIDNLKIPILVEDYVPVCSKKSSWNPETWENEALTDLAFSSFKKSGKSELGYTNLVSALKDYSGMGETNAKKFITYLLRMGIIQKIDMRYSMIAST